MALGISPDQPPPREFHCCFAAMKYVWESREVNTRTGGVQVQGTASERCQREREWTVRIEGSSDTTPATEKRRQLWRTRPLFLKQWSVAKHNLWQKKVASANYKASLGWQIFLIWFIPSSIIMSSRDYFYHGPGNLSPWNTGSALGIQLVTLQKEKKISLLQASNVRNFYFQLIKKLFFHWR